jgi:hypothetical protein
LLKPLKSTRCCSTCRRELLRVSACRWSRWQGAEEGEGCFGSPSPACPSSPGRRNVSAFALPRAHVALFKQSLRRRFARRCGVCEASASAQGTCAHQFRLMAVSAVGAEIGSMSARIHSSRRVNQRSHAGQHSRVAWPRALARSHWMLTVRTVHIASVVRQ